jgi:hypothetical protein
VTSKENMNRKLRCKTGIFKNFLIDARGEVTWSLDKTYVFPTRISGKKKKYVQIQLMRNGSLRWFYVHRLMAFSWLGESPHLLRLLVDHSDGDSFNNCVENLRWVTPTANQINKACRGIVEEDGMFYPKVSGYVHKTYGTQDEEVCQNIRKVLVECYVRYNCRFPNNGNSFPHKSIYKY